MKKCPECNGNGEILCPVCRGTKKDPRNEYNTCSYCGEDGYQK